MAKKEREKKLLKFPEIQDFVYKEVGHYIVDHGSSFTKVANEIGISVARFSELKVYDKSGKPVFPLSESVLQPLIRGGIVSLDSIRGKIDLGDTKKAEWLELQDILLLVEKAFKKDKDQCKKDIKELAKRAGVD